MIDLHRLADEHGLAISLLEEYLSLFEEHDVPTAPLEASAAGRVRRVIMVSTHGYWGDPPPAGVPDTGGQTHYVLEVSKAWARQGRQVIILARWFAPYPRVERLVEGVWLVRIRAGGDRFVRKEEIFQLAGPLAEAGTAVGALFGVEGVMGHYADGMAVAVEMAERLRLPAACVPHSLGLLKMLRLGWDPTDQARLRDPEYNFWIRESLELAALRAANFEVANTAREPEALAQHYGLRLPHSVMPAGAATSFFEAGERPVDVDALARFDLGVRRYVMFWGRLSEAKFVEGVVQVLGEARRARPDLAGNVTALIVGGSPGDPSGEEREVEAAIRTEMKRYGLEPSDVIRIESQTHAALAPLARGGLAYIGMQKLEPFGMGAAEAMGSGLPALISTHAGITGWLNDGEHALFVRPEDPHDAAEKLIALIEDPELWDRLSRNGREKALADFSWAGIAQKQGAAFDRLWNGEDPREPAAEPAAEPLHFSRRTGRAFHRSTPVWRGDLPRIEPHHVAASRQLVPPLVERARLALERGERLSVAIGGESGSGKSEIAHLLTLMLRAEGLSGVVIPGDAFFRLPPSANHANRVDADRRGCLAEAIGPQEVDLDRLEHILADARPLSTREVLIPSDCRGVAGRRYTDVPLALDEVGVLIVDLTYSTLLAHIECRVFLERSALEHIDSVRRRNLDRDPNQDFDFVRRVLELEHAIIGPLRERADIVVDKAYRVFRD